MPIIGGLMTPILAEWSKIPEFLGWPLTIVLCIPTGLIILGTMVVFLRKIFPIIFVSEKDKVTSVEFEFTKDSIRLVSERNIDDFKDITGYCMTNDNNSYQITILLKLKCPITVKNYRFDIVSTNTLSQHPFIKPSFGVVVKGLSDCVILNIGNIDIGNIYRIFAFQK